MPGLRSAASYWCSTAQAITIFPDLRVVLPRGIHGVGGTSHPVSSSNSRAAVSSSVSPRLTSPLTSDHAPRSLRAK